MPENKPNKTKIKTDKGFFIWVDEAKMFCKFCPEKEMLEFTDKDKKRTEKRGTRFVHLPISDLLTLLQSSGSNTHHCPACNKLKNVTFDGLDRVCECGYSWSINPFKNKQ